MQNSASQQDKNVLSTKAEKISSSIQTLNFTEFTSELSAVTSGLETYSVNLRLFLQDLVINLSEEIKKRVIYKDQDLVIDLSEEIKKHIIYKEFLAYLLCSYSILSDYIDCNTADRDGKFPIYYADLYQLKYTINDGAAEPAAKVINISASLEAKMSKLTLSIYYRQPTFASKFTDANGNNLLMLLFFHPPSVSSTFKEQVFTLLDAGVNPLQKNIFNYNFFHKIFEEILQNFPTTLDPDTSELFLKIYQNPDYAQINLENDLMNSPILRRFFDCREYGSKDHPYKKAQEMRKKHQYYLDAVEQGYPKMPWKFNKSEMLEKLTQQDVGLLDALKSVFSYSLAKKENGKSLQIGA